MEAELRAAEWYYSDGDSNEGPHSVTDLTRLFNSGTISEATYVWREAEPPLDWLPMTDPTHAVLLKMLRAAPRAAASVMSAIADAPPPTLASRTSGSYNNVWSKDFKTKDRSGSASGGGWKTGNAAEVAADDPPPPAMIGGGRGGFGGNIGTCAGCRLPLTPLDCVHALDQDWHEACFVCGVCGQPFGDAPFVNRGGKPFHKACHAGAFASVCHGCGQPIEGKFVTVDGRKYHKGCFLCATCSSTLEGGFLMVEGLPYCGEHAKEAKRAAARATVPTDAAGIAAAMAAGGGSGLVKSGEDRFLIDVKTGEQIFIEAGTDRKYRLGEGGKKLYEDLKPKKTYGGGGGSWQTSQVNASANRGAVAAGQGGFRRV